MTHLKSATSQRRVVVLAVDDDPRECQLLAGLLERIESFDIEVLQLCTPDGYPAVLGERRVDALLLAEEVRGASGSAYLAELRANGHGQPAILITEKAGEEQALEALHGGFADCLSKRQVSSRSLERAISNALEKSALSRNLDTYRADLEATVRSLEARNEEIQGFHHTLSHELRTPLTATREFISIVLEGILGSLTSEQHQALETARTGCDQIKTMIDDLLDQSRIETGKLSMEPAPCSARDLAMRALAYNQGAALRAKLNLAVEASVHLPWVKADARRVTQVLNNLISNAIKFTSAGGSIHVKAEVIPLNPGLIRFAVRDTGRGIPPERLGHIFDRHYQVRKEDHGDLGGLGLGLNLCRDLVQMHGGQLTVSSALGEGSTFYFTLPTCSSPSVANVIAPRPNIHQGSAHEGR